ncbi:MAG TPA: hypothetical protein VK172_15875 [Lentimicrobium sp.]|nr:hypothetical protein [Lentimicrobium sp.]
MYKSVNKPTLLLLFLSVLLLTSCLDEDPCPGEPDVIHYDEPFILRFRTIDEGNPFDTTIYKIDSLIIVENDDTVKFRYTTAGNDSILKFRLRTFNAPNIWSHFDSVMISQVIFIFDSITRDTLVVKATPKERKEPCNSTWYSSNEIFFNSLLIRENGQSPCYLCGDTLTLYINH